MKRMVMDVERIQKIGKLAGELVSHGMAEDMPSAMKQAENMMGKSNDFQIPRTDSNVNSANVSPSTISEDSELLIKLRKLNYRLNEQTEEIKNLKEQMFSMAKEISELKNTKHIIEKPIDKPQTILHEEPKKPVVESSNHARTGGYQPNDVSIEKYFYCGGK